METLIEVRGATRLLSDNFALENVSFALRPGEIVGFVGANGAGKTTVVRAILGQLHLDAGKIRLFGEPFGSAATIEAQRRLRGRIGVVLDTCPFPAELKVKQAAACIAPAFENWNASTFAALLDEFGISPKAKVRDLSRGMGMKLQLAVALSHGADLLILDEATAGLDPIARDEMLDRLREFASSGQRGVLLSSHITSDLDKIADNITFIHHGRVLLSEGRDELIDRHGVLRCTEEQLNALDPDAVRAVRKGAFGCEALVKRDGIPENWPVEPVSVEQIMMFLTKGEEVR